MTRCYTVKSRPRESEQTGDALRGSPTDPSVSILEGVAVGSPREEGEGFGAHLDDLLEEVTCRTRGAKAVGILQLAVKRGAFLGSFDHPHDGLRSGIGGWR